jgi:hypothetical protein
MTSNLYTLTSKGVAPEIIRSYVRESNFTLPKESEDWLDGPYAQGLGAEGRSGTTFESRPRPDTSAASAAWSGLKSGATMGWDDELNAATNAGANKLGQWLGLNATSAPLYEVYQQIVQKNREEKDAAFNDHHLAYGAGYVPGMLLSAFATRGRGAPAESMWGRVGQAALEGGKQGAMAGSGNAESGLGNALMGAVEGGALGAPLGALSYPIGVALSNIAGRIGGAVRARINPNDEMSGMGALDARAPQDPAAMRAAAEEMSAAGVPPRPVDVMDASGRGVVRTAASEMTPARQAVVQDSQDVAAAVQQRVRDAAAQHISDNPNTARQIAEDIAGPQGMPGTGTRGANMEAAIAPVRGDALPITDEIKSILGTREGQAALRGAEGLMTDPADRAAVRQVLKAATAKRVDAEDLFRKEIKGWDDLPLQVKDAYRAQRPDLVSPDPWEGVAMTVDMADKFARAMKGRAAKTPGLERVTTAFSNAIRGDARVASPAYDEALTNYAAESGVADAALGTGKFRGSSFLDDSADQFGSRVARASDKPAAIHAPDTTPFDHSPGEDVLSRYVDEDEFTDTYRLLNARLRAGKPLTAAQQTEADTLSESMRRTPLSEDTVLYRGMNVTKNKDPFKDGETSLPMSSFNSFSPDEDTGNWYAHMVHGPDGPSDELANAANRTKIMLRITAPKGTPHLAPTTGVEDEMLLGPGRFVKTGEAVDPQTGVRIIEGRYEASLKPPTAPSVSELDALRARARDEVVQRAGDNAGQGARGVARQIARGAEQQTKNALLLGPEQAMALQRRMAAEEARATNSEFINPNAGSKTNVAGRDAMVDGFADAVANSASGGKWAAVKIAARWLKNGGIRGVDAERLARDAISDDPARLEAAISYLEQKGLARSRAQRFLSTFSGALGGRAAGAAQDDKARAPSIARELYVTPTKQGVEK